MKSNSKSAIKQFLPFYQFCLYGDDIIPRRCICYSAEQSQTVQVLTEKTPHFEEYLRLFGNTFIFYRGHLMNISTQ